jgi:hypothetical protein
VAFREVILESRSIFYNLSKSWLSHNQRSNAVFFVRKPYENLRLLDKIWTRENMQVFELISILEKDGEQDF